MTNTIVNSQTELNAVNELLNKNLPSYRQAYSDRTAWIMACLSELAYIRFNPIFSNDKQKSWFIDKINTLPDENSKSSLLKLIDNEERKNLIKELSNLKMVLLETFDKDGTQAILISFKTNNTKFITLSFRCTEATSIKDIKSDLNAQTMSCETGGKIHTGFKEAFDTVALDIQTMLNEDAFKETPLFITGHSLGGALATIAAKKLSHEGGIAACYTFGAPRVGDDEWVSDFKTPVYRLVNAADCVTMLPPGDESITLFSWILRCIAWPRVIFISRWAELLSRSLLSKFGGYIHGGNMRYMTNCKPGQYGDVKLLYSVSLFRRIKGWFIKKLAWKEIPSDHSISVYRKKLMVIAEKRN